MSQSMNHMQIQRKENAPGNNGNYFMQKKKGKKEKKKEHPYRLHINM